MYFPKIFRKTFSKHLYFLTTLDSFFCNAVSNNVKSRCFIECLFKKFVKLCAVLSNTCIWAWFFTSSGSLHKWSGIYPSIMTNACFKEEDWVLQGEKRLQSNFNCSFGPGEEPWWDFRGWNPPKYWLFNVFKAIKWLTMALKTIFMAYKGNHVITKPVFPG